MSYLLTYLQSNFLEVPFFFIAHSLMGVRTTKRLGMSLGMSVLITTFANAITHPLVFFLWLSSGLQLTWFGGILLAEAFAVVTETALHGYTMKPHTKQGWFVLAAGSIIANLVSWEFGPILTWLTILK